MGKVTEKLASVFKRRSRQFDLEDYIERQKSRGYLGALQVVDPTPMAPPIGYERRPSIMEQVKAMVEQRLTELRETEDQETFEEADDFDVEDSDVPFDPKTPYENDFDPKIAELLQAGLAEVERKKNVKPPPSGAAPVPPEPGRTEASGSERSPASNPEKPL